MLLKGWGLGTSRGGLKKTEGAVAKEWPEEGS